MSTLTTSTATSGLTDQVDSRNHPQSSVSRHAFSLVVVPGSAGGGHASPDMSPARKSRHLHYVGAAKTGAANTHRLSQGWR